MADMKWLGNVGIGLGLTLGAGIATVVATKEIKKGSEGCVDWISGLVSTAIEAGKAHKEVATTATEAATNVAETVAETVTTVSDAVNS